MNSTTMPKSVSATHERAGEIAERAAARADEALVGARRAAAHTARSVEAGLDELRETVPGAVARAAAQVEDLTRRSVEHARETAEDLRHRALDLGDATVRNIQDRPVRAVVVAAAAGAAATLLVQWLSRSRPTA